MMRNTTPLTLPLAIFALFLLASYLIPFHFHPYRSFFNDASAIASVILGLSMLGLSTKATIRIPSAVGLPLFLIVIIALQTWNGMLLYSVDSVFPILYLMSLAIAMVFGATIVAYSDGLTRLSTTVASVFVTAGVLSVLMQIVQLFNLNFYPFVMPMLHDRAWRPFGNLGQPNLLSIVECFSVASCWYLYVTRHLKASVAFGLIALLLVGIALTQARICWVILPMLLLFCWQQPKDSPKVSKLILIFLFLLYVALVIFTPDVMSQLGVILDSAGERASQTSVRLVLWEQAWFIAKLHPWFGAGWFQFGVEQAMISSLFEPTEYSDYAHNIVLDLATGIGWPATVLIFVAAAYWFYPCCIRQWHNVSVRFMSIVLVILFVHSLVEFPLWFGYLLIPFGVIVGALSSERLGWKNVPFAKGWAAAFLLASIIVMSAITWDHKRVVDGFVALAWQQAGEKQGIGSTDKPEFTLFPQYYDYFHVAKIKIYPGMPKADVDFIQRVALRFAYTPILGRLALAYVYNQRPTEALQVLIAIHRLDGIDYPKIYANWKGYAKDYPLVYGEIFKRLPER